MLRKLYNIFSMTALAVVIAALSAQAQNNLARVYDDSDNEDYTADQYYNNVKIDRYLDIDVWTNHPDGEFYVGDKVTIDFRTNRDAFVAIYTVDSKGRVNLLFPTGPSDDNFVRGGETYQIPGGGDDFDLVVTGPEGTENIQAIASRERFPIPDWYPTSGLVLDRDDRFDFMDYVNGRFFVGYDGQRFAFDRSAMYVDQWEDNYYRPVYYPDYPAWTLTGNVYIDYPWGGTVYVNGVYWGIAPLYIPRIFVGWHTLTIYDRYGYCWEHDVHITRYNTVVLNRNVIHTSSQAVSKYKEVRTIGYRDPVKNGYPKYKTADVFRPEGKVVATNPGSKTVGDVILSKKHVRGTSEVIRTDRGYETAGSTLSDSKRERSAYKVSEGVTSDRTGTRSKVVEGRTGGDKYDRGSQTIDRSSEATKRSSERSSDYYQKKSGSSGKSEAAQPKRSQPKVEQGKSGGGSSERSSSTVRRAEPSGNQKSSGEAGSRGKSSESKSSGSSKKSGGRR